MALPKLVPRVIEFYPFMAGTLQDPDKLQLESAIPTPFPGIYECCATGRQADPVQLGDRTVCGDCYLARFVCEQAKPDQVRPLQEPLGGCAPRWLGTVAKLARGRDTINPTAFITELAKTNESARDSASLLLGIMKKSKLETETFDRLVLGLRAFAAKQGTAILTTADVEAHVFRPSNYDLGLQDARVVLIPFLIEGRYRLFKLDYQAQSLVLYDSLSSDMDDAKINQSFRTWIGHIRDRLVTRLGRQGAYPAKSAERTSQETSAADNGFCMLYNLLCELNPGLARSDDNAGALGRAAALVCLTYWCLPYAKKA
jgi:hypothetical protein